MKIHDVEGFPNPARVRLALAKRVQRKKVEFIFVDAMGVENRSEAFRAMETRCGCPCLRLEDGTHISQRDPITEDIDGTFDGPL